MTASPLIASYLRCCLGTAKVVKHRDIILRIRALASSSVIAPPFKTFSVHFKICSQLLSIFKSSGRMAGSCLCHTLRVIRNRNIRV